MNTKFGYKLFELDTESRMFYPLFIGKKKPIGYWKWYKAENITEHRGFAHRPGWHIGEIPSAPWLMSADGTYKSQRGKRFKRVWCMVEYKANFDYTAEAQAQKGKCFTDRLIQDGYYRFREVGNRDWIISSDIRILMILSEGYRQRLLKSVNFNEIEEFEPYRKRFVKRGIINE